MIFTTNRGTEVVAYDSDTGKKRGSVNSSYQNRVVFDGTDYGKYHDLENALLKFESVIGGGDLESADGTRVVLGSADEIVDADLSVWTLTSAGNVNRNGANFNAGQASRLLYLSHTVYMLSLADGYWYHRSESAWVVDTQDDPEGVADSANGTEVVANGDTITFSDRYWNIVNASVFCNGVIYTDGGQAALLRLQGGVLYHQHPLPAQGGDGHWFFRNENAASPWVDFGPEDPAQAASADGTKVPTHGNTIRLGSKVYSIGGGANLSVLENGEQFHDGGFTDLMKLSGGVLYARQPLAPQGDGHWYHYSAGWVDDGTTEPGTLTDSANGFKVPDDGSSISLGGSTYTLDGTTVQKDAATWIDGGPGNTLKLWNQVVYHKRPADSHWYYPNVAEDAWLDYGATEPGTGAFVTTGTIQGGSTSLTVANPDLFPQSAIDAGKCYAIVEIGFEAVNAATGSRTPGKRGTIGVGGTWPQYGYIYANFAAIAAAANAGQIPVGQFCGAMDTGMIWILTSTNPVVLKTWYQWQSQFGRGYSYYTKKFLPRALHARVVSKSGNVLTLDTAATVTATNANVYYDQVPVLQDAATAFASGTFNFNTVLGGATSAPLGGVVRFQNKISGGTIKGNGESVCRLYSVRGCAPAQIEGRYLNGTWNFEDFTLESNKGDDYYGLNWNHPYSGIAAGDGPSTDNANGWGASAGPRFPHGVHVYNSPIEQTVGVPVPTATTDANWSINFTRITVKNDFQKGIGGSFCRNIYDRDCTIIHTSPTREYVQWHFMHSSCWNAWHIDWTFTSDHWDSAAELLTCHGGGIIRGMGRNSSTSSNGSYNFVVGADPDNPTLNHADPFNILNTGELRFTAGCLDWYWNEPDGDALGSSTGQFNVISGITAHQSVAHNGVANGSAYDSDPNSIYYQQADPTWTGIDKHIYHLQVVWEGYGDDYYNIPTGVLGDSRHTGIVIDGLRFTGKDYTANANNTTNSAQGVYSYSPGCVVKNSTVTGISKGGNFSNEANIVAAGGGINGGGNIAATTYFS